MSLARRSRALKMVESTNRMMGLSASSVSFSMEISSPVSSSLIRVKPSVASSSTRWEDSLFLSMSPIWEARATLTTNRFPNSVPSSSCSINSLGSEMATIKAPLTILSGTKL